MHSMVVERFIKEDSDFNIHVQKLPQDSVEVLPDGLKKTKCLVACIKKKSLQRDVDLSSRRVLV